MRLTKEREAELRADNGCEGYACDRANVIADLLAELDAVRAELDEWKTHLIAEDERLLLTESVVVMERQLTRACAERDAARADERAKVVAWLRAEEKRLNALKGLVHGPPPPSRPLPAPDRGRTEQRRKR